MKKLLQSTFVLAFLLVSTSSFAQSKFDKWVELKTFHGVMSQTFHPSEEGDLKPIKTRIAEFCEKAKALNTAKIPDEFNKPSVKEATEAIEKEANALKALIEKGGSDAEITAALAHLHDTFHLIVERCNKNDEDHKKEGH